MNIARALQSAFAADKRRDLMFMRWLRTVPIIGGTLDGQRGPEGGAVMEHPMVTAGTVAAFAADSSTRPQFVYQRYVRDGDVWRYDRTHG